MDKFVYTPEITLKNLYLVSANGILVALPRNFDVNLSQRTISL